jgi:tetratricopeptide (TPR) repeat protein
MRTFCAAAVLMALAGDARAQSAQVMLGPWEQFEAWVTAIGTHEPGRNDAAIASLVGMTAGELESLFPHMVFSLRAAADLEARGDRRFDALFLRYGTRAHRPADEQRIAAAANRIIGIGLDTFLKRAAMLHADVALKYPDAHLSRSAGRGFVVSDGRHAGDEGRPWHWILGRAFLHTVRNAQADPFVLLWYQAVGNRALTARNFTEAEPHILRGLGMFPRDAEISFLAGWSHDAQAAPVIQAAVAEELDGLTMQQRRLYLPAIKTAKAEQQDAIEAFEKAIALDPSHVEARIRLARLLTMHGKPEGAVEHLRAALALTADVIQRYYAQLFLGSALEALKQPGAARAAFEAARDLMPGAQSPRLALSQIALHAGDHGTAREVMAFITRSEGTEDPWWDYHFLRHPGPDVWFDRLRALLREEQK